MKIIITPYFRRKYVKLARKDKFLSELMDKHVHALILGNRIPSAHIHKLTGNKREYWSISVKQNLRVVFKYSTQGIIFIDIGSHDEVY